MEPETESLFAWFIVLVAFIGSVVAIITSPDFINKKWLPLLFNVNWEDRLGLLSVTLFIIVIICCTVLWFTLNILDRYFVPGDLIGLLFFACFIWFGWSGFTLWKPLPGYKRDRLPGRGAASDPEFIKYKTRMIWMNFGIAFVFLIMAGIWTVFTESSGHIYLREPTQNPGRDLNAAVRNLESKGDSAAVIRQKVNIARGNKYRPVTLKIIKGNMKNPS